MTETLGRRLRSRRYLAGLTLKRAGAAAGVSVSFLSDIERGVTNPSVATLRRLAAFYGVATDSLLGEADMSETIQPVDRITWRPGNEWQSGEVVATDGWRDGGYVQREADEYANMLAVSQSPFELIADDYTQLMQMGDLGGAELG